MGLTTGGNARGLRRQSGHGKVDGVSTTREVIDYAKRHGGVITTREALALGLPQSTLTRRVSDGIFVRIGRGLLALPGTSTRPDVMLRAAGRLLITDSKKAHTKSAGIKHLERTTQAVCRAAGQAPSSIASFLFSDRPTATVRRTDCASPSRNLRDW